MAVGRCDFFVSRRGSVATVAQEVEGVLTDKGYSVVVQDYDIPITANFIEVMHEAIKAARDLVVLFSRDYETSPYTRKEFTSFEADRAQTTEERRVIILRCEDVPLRGLFAPNVYQDLVGIDDPAERRTRIPAAVTQATGVGRVAVQGMGGVGKTSLATEYAHRYRDLFAGVWWCAAETRIGLLTSLAGLAVRLGAATADDADVERTAKTGLAWLAEQRATFLLIYDNVTMPEDIADLLPAGGARVLITSRFSDWGGLAEEVALDVLPQAEAVAFLQGRTERQDAAGARVLAEALGRLPLALDHAAAYCKRTQMGFAEYAAKAENLIDVQPRVMIYPRTVAATFQLAIGEAVKTCPAAEALMAYLAQCAPERIPLQLVNGAIEDEAQRTMALLALTDMSLAHRDPFEDGAPAVTVHRLVQAVGRRQHGGDLVGTAAGRLILRLAEIYPPDAYENHASWPLCEQLTPHLLAVHEALAAEDEAGDDAQRAGLLDMAANYFHGRGAYRRAEKLSRAALAIFEKKLGPEHSHTGMSLNNLAFLLQALGDLAGARPLYERALAIAERELGPDHSDTAMALHNLAVLLQSQGDLAGAQPLLERALAIRENTLGPEHSHTGMSLNNLAFLLHAQGELTAARPLYERALSIDEQALGAEHRNTATSLNNLGRLLQAQGDLAGAQPLLERALAIRERVLGPEHPDTAGSLNNLALLMQAQGHLFGARPLYQRAIAICEKVLGPKHPNTGRCQFNYARLLLRNGQPADALLLGETALATHEAAFGSQHPWTVDSASVAADTLDALNRINEAAALRRRYGLGRDS